MIFRDSIPIQYCIVSTRIHLIKRLPNIVNTSRPWKRGLTIIDVLTCGVVLSHKITSFEPFKTFLIT